MTGKVTIESKDISYRVTMEFSNDDTMIRAVKQLINMDDSHEQPEKHSNFNTPPEKTQSPIQEIPKFEITGPWIYLKKYSSHIRYFELDDGRLCINYQSGMIYTTWDEILSAYKQPDIMKKIGDCYRSNNCGTAMRMFMRAVGDGLRPGKAEQDDLPAGSQADLNEDPDADFKPHLTSYSTRIADDGGKIEGSLE